MKPLYLQSLILLLCCFSQGNAQGASIWQQATPIVINQAVSGTLAGQANKVTAYHYAWYYNSGYVGYSNSAPDRIYRFTVAVPTLIKLPTGVSNGNTFLLLRDTLPSIEAYAGYPSRVEAWLDAGTHYVVVEGGGTAPSYSFTLESNPAPGVWKQATPIPVGQAISGTLTGQVNKLTDYGSVVPSGYGNFPYFLLEYSSAAAERIYSFTLSQASYVRVPTLASGNKFVLLNDSSSYTLLAFRPSGTEPGALLRAGRHYLVIEGGGSSPAYTFTIEATPYVSPWRQATPVSPGQQVTGTLAGQTNQFSAYCTVCTPASITTSGYNFPSADRVFTFTLPEPCYVIVPKVGNGNAFVLLKDSSAASLAGNNFYGDSSYDVTYLRVALPAGRHYFVLENTGSQPQYNFRFRTTRLLVGDSITLPTGSSLAKGQIVVDSLVGQPNYSRYFYAQLRLLDPHDDCNFFYTGGEAPYLNPVLYSVPGHQRVYSFTLTDSAYVQARLAVAPGISKEQCDIYLLNDRSNASVASYPYMGRRCTYASSDPPLVRRLYPALGDIATSKMGPGTHYILVASGFDHNNAYRLTVNWSATEAGFYQSTTSTAGTIGVNQTLTSTLAGQTNKVFFTLDPYNVGAQTPYYPYIYSPGADKTYKLSLSQSRRVTISLASPDSNSIKHRFLLSEGNSKTAEEGFGSLDVTLAAGTHYITVEQASATVTDRFTLSVQGSTCSPTFFSTSSSAYLSTFIVNNKGYRHYLPGNPYSYPYSSGSPEVPVGAAGDTMKLYSDRNNEIKILGVGVSAVRIYVDLNDNGNFDDAGELLYTNLQAGGYIYDNVVLGSNAALQAARGKFRVMRVIGVTPLTLDLGACGNYSSSGANGTYRDYTVYIPPAAPAAAALDFRFARMASSVPEDSTGGVDTYTRVRTAPDQSLYAAGTYDSHFHWIYPNLLGSYLLINGLPGLGAVQTIVYNPQYPPARERGSTVVAYTREGGLRWSARLQSSATIDGPPYLTPGGRVEILGMTVDKNNAVYVCGSFIDSLLITPPAGNPVNLLAPADNRDAFIAKFSASGALEFAYAIGGAGDQVATGIDASASLYYIVSGTFTGTTAFRGRSGQTISRTSRGGKDVFFTKFSQAGAMQWLVTGGGTADDEATATAYDKAGNAFVAGHYAGTAVFSTSVNGTTASRTAAGGTDGFVLSGGTTGAIGWVTSLGGTMGESVRDIAPDPRGTGLVAVGSFAGTAAFGAGGSLASSGLSDAFAARLTTAGAVQWAKKAGSAGADTASGVRLDKQGNPWVALQYGGAVSSAFGGQALASRGGADGVVLRLAAATGVQDASALAGLIGGPGLDKPTAIDTVEGGGAIVAGAASEGVRFGALGRLGNLGATDAFIARYSAPAAGVGRIAEGTYAMRELLVAEAGLSAYPNPASRSVTFCYAELAAGDYTLTLMDMRGRTVAIYNLTAAMLATGYVLDLQLPPGVYMARCNGSALRLAVTR